MSNDMAMVKVVFRIPLDGDEVIVKSLWATPLGDERFRLENSPFFAYGVSWLDVVLAAHDEGRLHDFVSVAEKSGHRTVRVIVDREEPQRDALLALAKALGCKYEGFQPRLYAIDVPPAADLATVAARLTEAGYEWEHADPTYEELYGPDA
jgi:hypothetical protein